ncbi:MAG: glycosyltransferase family 1 protein [Desulfuromonas sp.]|nr:MAG: glycosyltransferase family 1 protein [Desulfuromonas sp.]
MKILSLTDTYDRPETEIYISLKKSGIDIELLVRPEPEYPRVQEAGIKTTDFYVNGRFDLKAIMALRRILKKEKYDILHVWNNRAASVGVLASIGLPVKIIDYRGIVGNVSFFSPNSWITYFNPKVKKVVCVADAIRRYFVQMNFLGFKLNPEKFKTIYKGHDQSWYTKDPVDLKQFGIPQGSFVVGFAGRDRPRKGIENLVEAVNLLPEDVDIHLLLVGKIHRRSLLKLIESSPRRDSIHLAGYRNDAPEIAAACSTFALPSLKGEGFPRAVVEAMSYGTVPIVSDRGGNPELPVDGVSGFIIPGGNSKGMAEAILKLYHDPELRKKMGAAARQRIIDNFNHQKTVEITIDLYKEVVSM